MPTKREQDFRTLKLIKKLHYVFIYSKQAKQIKNTSGEVGASSNQLLLPRALLSWWHPSLWGKIHYNWQDRLCHAFQVLYDCCHINLSFPIQTNLLEWTSGMPPGNDPGPWPTLNGRGFLLNAAGDPVLFCTEPTPRLVRAVTATGRGVLTGC